MTPSQAASQVFAAFHTKWPLLVGVDGSGAALVPYSIDNTLKSDSTRSARVMFTETLSEQQTLGKLARFENTGVIEVRLTGPLNEGRGPLDELAGFVRSIYERKRLGARVRDGGVITQAVSIAPLRRDGESRRLWLLSCTAPFTYYEIRPQG